MRAQAKTEIFITTESGDLVISEGKVREGEEFISYEKTGAPVRVQNIGNPESREGDQNFYYQKQESFEEWRRPDGTIFTERTEDVQKVAKPKPANPVPAAASQVVNNQEQGGHRDIIKNVVTFGRPGSDCIVM